MRRIFCEIGRNDQIWTGDPYHPKVVRYQAAPRPDILEQLLFVSLDQAASSRIINFQLFLLWQSVPIIIFLFSFHCYAAL